MKGALLAAAAAVLTGGASAAHDHRHAHQALFEKRGHNDTGICVPGCTTVYTTITGEAGLYFPPVTATPKPVTTSKPPVPTTPAGPITVPTPIAQTCPTPGVYTFPATTVVVTETITACGASTTVVPSGTHTLGGVTTIVETATTVVCPYATTKTVAGVVTSVIETTTYVCPSAGTYTIGPITTAVTKTETVVVPVVATYCPGTYTADAVITTIVETATVVYCPFTTPAPAPVATVAPVAQAQAAAPAPQAASPSPAAVVPVAAQAAASKPNKGSPKLGAKGDKWAMTYTPYTPSGDCKGPSEVMSDVSAIARLGFDTLRVYSTDCDTLPNVGAAAAANGLKLIVGVFIGKVGCDNTSPDVAHQVAALKEWAAWDMVSLVVVANEALFNKFCTVDQLRDLIVHVKTELGSVGYTGPLTTTDVVSAWLEQDVSSICSVIDVVACNAHAYFNAGTRPEAAGSFVAGQLALVEKVCGKSGYVMETGWPKAGVCNGEACAGPEQQRTAIHSIKEALGKKAVFFSFTDDPWKKPGACNCEQSWGCGEVFGA
ncbi:glycoside hydrolase [Podospora didyma]|uniref:Probable beta-glucosidase btgE n=1 Tax=Podospora didyma TaxID=330526 RepID=A0AAE0U8E8_9PEZI|nr:glycoside hydrolase [Podospora didyma]